MISWCDLGVQAAPAPPLRTYLRCGTLLQQRPYVLRDALIRLTLTYHTNMRAV